MNDKVDKLVIFLAKRDGIDKLVKTFQYVSKLVHYQIEKSHPDYAGRAKQWEVAAGLSRKAFRSGRFLTGFNALRRSPGPTPGFRLLAVLANAGEMVYFFFDHFLWLSRIGVLDARLARRMSFVSAFGESFGYVFFIIADLIMIRDGIREERRIGDGDGKAGLVGGGLKLLNEIREQKNMLLLSKKDNNISLVIYVSELRRNFAVETTTTLGREILLKSWIARERTIPMF
ncbi:hypothetical protein SASPL_114537 [Salvia splendens]|uniref:Peroxisomal membrane protein 11B n=1 Tax=Salvia splendens TaxID=180675 RepID=A0A8X9A249_SALSN|nr:hypothetical protein SASPL_114537 [Salvia splendens]